MAAYYNEYDKKAAAWLRHLIKDGLIADGEVDERSITDVQPKEIEKFTQHHFFAGIGGWSLALRMSGWSDDRPVLTGSCPCQPFSSAGSRKGVDDERHLWPDLYRIIDELRPDVAFGEQVASKDGLAWLDIVYADLEKSNYTPWSADLCAASVGAPHIRQRLYWLAHSNNQRWSAPSHSGHRKIEVERDRNFDRMEDTSIRNSGSKRKQRGREHGLLTQYCFDFDMGNSESKRLEGGRCEDTGGCDSRVPEGRNIGQRSGGSVLHLDDTSGRGFGRSGSSTEAEARARGQREEWQLQSGSERSGHYDEYEQILHNSTFWGNCDAIYCRDEKWRIIESGTEPLANGFPGRMELLRGYGNAIVPQVAKEFIMTYMETIGG